MTSRVLHSFETMDAIDYLRFSYLGAALAVLLVSFVPPFRPRFLAYGPRAWLSREEKEKRHIASESEKQSERANIFTNILDEAATWTFPHDWFAGFYFISTSLSAFWPGEALYLHGPLFGAIASRVDVSAHGGASMTFRQVQVAWAMLLVQGARRLYECLIFPSSSKSQMWGGHLVLGIAFYVVTSVAVWIEGVPAIKSHTLTYTDLLPTAPSIRTLLSVTLFILASGFQHDCHNYLAHLKTTTDEKTEAGQPIQKEGDYKLPTHPAFASLVCPHYTAECFIYLSLALAAAPAGKWVNGTLVCALVFVGVNLGVTADGTRQWYVRRFGEGSVEGKWRMVPMIW